MDASTTASTRKGSLVIAGSGIASVGDLTLHAVAHIEKADRVFYVVADPVTEAFIHSKNKNSVDLYQYYDNDKNRSETYVQMAEVMLQEVRLGKKVVGVFYGHPGVFVAPSHRAISIARFEGYEAKMLPAVSAEDSLYADLGIDPSRPGCVTYEASDILLRERPVLTSTHLIIFQVGLVGIADFNFRGHENKNLGILVDRLETEYGPDHPVVHYVAAVLPLSKPTIDRHTVADLRKPDVAQKINGISTFYIPPKESRSTSQAVVEQLGLGSVRQQIPVQDPTARWRKDYQPSQRPPNDLENKAISDLSNHAPPPDYNPLKTSPAMAQLMINLALDCDFAARYHENPSEFAKSTTGLTDMERSAIESGDSMKMRFAMRGAKDGAPPQFENFNSTTVEIVVESSL